MAHQHRYSISGGVDVGERLGVTGTRTRTSRGDDEVEDHDNSTINKNTKSEILTSKLPDFETLLRSGASIKVVGSGSRDLDTLGQSPQRATGGGESASSSPYGSPVRHGRRGREGALRDIEREMSRTSPGAVEEEEGGWDAGRAPRETRHDPVLLPGQPIVDPRTINATPSAPSSSTTTTTTTTSSPAAGAVTKSGSSAPTSITTAARDLSAVTNRTGSPSASSSSPRRRQPGTDGPTFDIRHHHPESAYSSSPTLKTDGAGPRLMSSAMYDLPASDNQRVPLVARSVAGQSTGVTLRTSTPPPPRSRVGSNETGALYSTPTSSPGRASTTVASLSAAMESPRQKTLSMVSTGSASDYIHIPPSHRTTRAGDAGAGTVGNTSSPVQDPSSAPIFKTTSFVDNPSDVSISKVHSNSTTNSGKQKHAQKKLTKGHPEETTFSNAMRKTGGFLRRTFGTTRDPSPQSQNPSSRRGSASAASTSMSAPSTPTTSGFSTSTWQQKPSQPPVPAIPSAYASFPINKTQTPAAGRRSLGDHDIGSMPRSASVASRDASSSSHHPSPGKSIRSVLTPSSRSHASTTSIPNELRASTRFSALSENERLQRELDNWQINDGALMASQAEDASAGDYSASTIKARSPAKAPSISSFTSIANSSHNNSTLRTRSTSGKIIVSGSLPSPTSSQPSSPQANFSQETYFMSGSMPSPRHPSYPQFRAANNVREDSATSTDSASTATSAGTVIPANGTPVLSQKDLPKTPRTPKASDPDQTGDNPFWVSARTKETIEQEQRMLQSASGKTVRKRTTSSTASPDPTAASTDKTLVISATPPSHQQASLGSAAAAATPEQSVGTFGLGIATPSLSVITESGASSETERESPEHTHAASPRGRIPSVVTHSPSPAHQGVAAECDPVNLPGTSSPTRPPSTSGASMYPSSPASSLNGHTIKTPRLGVSTLISSPKIGTAEENALPLEERAKVFAEKCWNEDETFLKKEKIAEWLGGHANLKQLTLRAYIEHFDFKGLRLDLAFRRLCDKLYLKAETQQVDRILAAFSAKYYVDNPDTIFAEKDIIHAATYAILLLNTDLHVADVIARMSRSDFVYNTMSAIHAQSRASPYIKESSDNAVTPQRERLEPVSDAGSAVASKIQGATVNVDEHSVSDKPVRQSTSMPAVNTRAWDTEVEAALKDIYAAVKATPIMQPIEYSQLSPPDSALTSPYSTWGAASRTLSRRSTSNFSSPLDRPSASKRNSIRGFLGAASHESLRAPSPTPSGGTSTTGLFSQTASFGSSMTGATSYYPATIGFASNLSHSIIREQQEEDAASDTSDDSATDEELALLGAPWAKEGILQRKHYWDAPNKRSKDKHWTQVFAVIARGDLKMFQFGATGSGAAYGASVGGGNWLNNAQSVGELSLRHSLCSAMPPPGYNRSRPHVLVLTLANGGSYFFQAGTEDLVNEWVLTCNYWAGRTSKEPLLGGVSNMDYGWNRVKGLTDGESKSNRNSLTNDTEDLASVLSGKSGHSRKSKISYAGSISRYSVLGHHSHSARGGEHEGDRITIKDWIPPQPPVTTSTLSEEAQLDSLRKHTAALQKELEQHQNLCVPMQRLYSPRSLNAAKSMSNWEKKSKYLLAELVKYQTYVEALKIARAGRQKKRDENQVKRLLEKADESTTLDDPVYSPKEYSREFGGSPRQNGSIFAAKQGEIATRSPNDIRHSVQSKTFASEAERNPGQGEAGISAENKEETDTQSKSMPRPSRESSTESDTTTQSAEFHEAPEEGAEA